MTKKKRQELIADPKIKELVQAAHCCWENCLDPTDAETYEAGLKRLGKILCEFLDKPGSNPNVPN